MKIDITKITNPILRKALENRTGNFMFNYGESSNPHSESASHAEYGGSYEEKYEEYNDIFYQKGHIGRK